MAKGAGVHAAQGTPWPIEMTDIGAQYVIPGCERRTPPASILKEVSDDRS